MNEDKVVIEIKWPWTMLPIAVTDDWIEAIKEGIAKTDPIYGKEIFPSARHEEQNLVLVDNDTDGNSVIMSFQRNKTGKLKFDVIETLVTPTDVANRLNEYHVEAMSRLKR
jgi:hypothetical protein